MGQLSALTDTAGGSVSYTYDGFLPKSTTFAGTVSRSYNTDFQVRAFCERQPQGARLGQARIISCYSGCNAAWLRMVGAASNRGGQTPGNRFDYW